MARLEVEQLTTHELSKLIEYNVRHATAELRDELRRLQEQLRLALSPYLTVQEAAQLLKCSEETIRRKIKAGQIPATFDGNKWLIRREDLIIAIESGHAENF